MPRQIRRAALLFTAALATTGCASVGLGADEPAAASEAKAKPDASAEAPYELMMAKLPHDLDGEIRRAQLLRAGGDFPATVKALSQLMLVAPDDPRIVGEYGKVLIQQGRTDDALAFLSRAVELQPDNWTFYSALGVAYDQKRERAKAEDAYKHALALKPDEPSVLNNYAMSQMQAGHLDRAEALLHEAEASGTAYPKIANNLAMIAEMRAKAARNGAPESAVAPQSAIARAEPKLAPASQAQPAEIGAPRPLLHAPAGTATPRVVMQKLPDDPLAGKHYATPTPHAVARARPKAPEQHVAVAETAAPEQDAKPAIPALRTAADTY